MPAIQQADGTIVHLDPVREMAAHDSLSPRLRKALNDSLNPPPALLVVRWLSLGWYEEVVLQIIRDADMAYHRDGVARGLVADSVQSTRHDLSDRKRRD